MALINCPECNHEVSDKASSCPHCGYELPKPKPTFQGVYCPSCLDLGIKTDIEVCPFCHTKYKNSIYGTLDEIYDYEKSHPEIKQSPEFSQEAYNRRVNYVPYEYGSGTSSKIKCPTCGSTNTSKIGTLNRMASVGLLGLASSKIGKMHKCNNCGSTW